MQLARRRVGARLRSHAMEAPNDAVYAPGTMARSDGSRTVRLATSLRK